MDDIAGEWLTYKQARNGLAFLWKLSEHLLVAEGGHGAPQMKSAVLPVYYCRPELTDGYDRVGPPV